MNIVFNLPPALLIGLLVSTVLPILTGLVTTRVTAPGWKAVILAGLSAATGLFTELGASVNAGTAYDLGNGLVLALIAFLVATAAHFGFWKPTTVADKVADVLVTAKTDASGVADITTLPPTSL